MESIQPIADLIDQHLAEMDGLMTALIFISENVEDHQHELMRHATVTLAYSVYDKIKAANRQMSRLMRAANENAA